jgi:hypothetical protein
MLSRTARLWQGKKWDFSIICVRVTVFANSVPVHVFAFRWSALAFAFLRNASQKLEDIEEESESLLGLLKVWEKQEQRQARSRAGKTKVSKKKEVEETAPTKVWANVRFTDEFCMVKNGSFPFWPAKKCEVKDKNLKSSLHTIGCALVALIGEDGGLRAVRLEDIRPFTGDMLEENMDEQPKHIRTQLDEVRTHCLHRVLTFSIRSLTSSVVLCGSFSACTWLGASYAAGNVAAWGTISKRRKQHYNVLLEKLKRGYSSSRLFAIRFACTFRARIRRSYLCVYIQSSDLSKLALFY